MHDPIVHERGTDHRHGLMQTCMMLLDVSADRSELPVARGKHAAQHIGRNSLKPCRTCSSLQCSLTITSRPECVLGNMLPSCRSKTLFSRYSTATYSRGVGPEFTSPVCFHASHQRDPAFDSAPGARRERRAGALTACMRAPCTISGHAGLQRAQLRPAWQTAASQSLLLIQL